MVYLWFFGIKVRFKNTPCLIMRSRPQLSFPKKVDTFKFINTNVMMNRDFKLAKGSSLTMLKGPEGSFFTLLLWTNYQDQFLARNSMGFRISYRCQNFCIQNGFIFRQHLLFDKLFHQAL